MLLLCNIFILFNIVLVIDIVNSKNYAPWRNIKIISSNQQTTTSITSPLPTQSSLDLNDVKDTVITNNLKSDISPPIVKSYAPWSDKKVIKKEIDITTTPTIDATFKSIEASIIPSIGTNPYINSIEISTNPSIYTNPSVKSVEVSTIPSVDTNPFVKSAEVSTIPSVDTNPFVKSVEVSTIPSVDTNPFVKSAEVSTIPSVDTNPFVKSIDISTIPSIDAKLIEVSATSEVISDDKLLYPLDDGVASKIEIEKNLVVNTLQSSQTFSSKYEPPLTNFEDPFVECVSESSSSTGYFASGNTISKAQLNYATTEKQLNFNDNEVDCVSEGGSWNIPVSTLSSDTSSNEQENIDYYELVKEKVILIYNLSIIDDSAIGLIKTCDLLDEKSYDNADKWLIKQRRQMILISLLQNNYNNYIDIVSFLSNRIPRNELPNVQDIPYPNLSTDTNNNVGNVNSCELPKIIYNDSILDQFLLFIFRSIVRKEINYKSSVKGIKGLLEEGRHYMLSKEGTPENQHKFVKNSLGGLLTPVLPPFYRLFMSGIIPSVDNNDPKWLTDFFSIIKENLPYKLQKYIESGKQYGPLPYAPFLTSVVTPPFLKFLVGPSRINRRKDGKLGGIVVEKCKFLQESNCKGLCLHQCKLPAQQFFQDTLGLSLSVSPNFVTQECQWSWGEVPIDPDIDPSFPKGCINDCPY